VIADDDRMDFSLAADEQADLAVDFTGDKGQLPGQILCDNILRWYAFETQTLYLFDLRGFQPCRISRNFINW